MTSWTVHFSSIQRPMISARAQLRNEALTTYFKDNAITFKQLETIQASLMNNTKLIIPEGKALTLILNELQNFAKESIIPIPMQPQKK